MVIELSEIYLTIDVKEIKWSIEAYINFCLEEYNLINKLYDNKLPNPYEIRLFTNDIFVDKIVKQLKELNIDYKLVELSDNNISITLYSKVKFY